LTAMTPEQALWTASLVEHYRRASSGDAMSRQYLLSHGADVAELAGADGEKFSFAINQAASQGWPKNIKRKIKR